MNLMIKPENPARPNFVGIASGIDLRNPQDEETIQVIDRAMDQYAVLVFRG
jgi:alpha-ketoglutarate-dependent 2,4-dichlorophenoxyacetate dioxygenase